MTQNIKQISKNQNYTMKISSKSNFCELKQAATWTWKTEEAEYQWRGTIWESRIIFSA